MSIASVPWRSSPVEADMAGRIWCRAQGCSLASLWELEGFPWQRYGEVRYGPGAPLTIEPRPCAQDADAGQIWRPGNASARPLRGAGARRNR
jgi:hypothetical protein